MRALLFALVVIAGCSADPGPSDATPDATPDAAQSDADASSIERDTGVIEESDAGTAAGFGVISGSCGEIDTELTSSTAATFSNRIDFGDDPYDDSDSARLTEGGREIISDGNAGGSSLLSEVFAYEVLERCEGAVLLKTETEVEYIDAMGKITDLLVSIDGLKVGVSVTRAVTFPRDAPYTEDEAQVLLERKLEDIQLSSARVSPSDRWVKQILHVLAYGPPHAAAMLAAYEKIDPTIRADTILIVTESVGDDEFIY